MTVKGPVILLLENDSDDAFFFRRALARLGYTGSVHTADGLTEARDYLERSSTDAQYPRPDLIVCDMKLLGSTGNDFLEWIRTQDAFRAIPVVMLSGSSLPEDRARAMDLGARGFYPKTIEAEQLEGHVRELLKNLPQPKCD